MSKMITRKVYFRVPVTFKAESESGIKHAIRNYVADPCPSVFGCNVDHGCYEHKQGKPSRLTDIKERS